MSTGIVYLRPVPVLFVRTRGPLLVASRDAWEKLLGWAETKGLRNEVARTYGLIRDHRAAISMGDTRYDACMEVSPDASEDTAAGIGMQMLPGGAHARQRHTGGAEMLGSAFRHLCEEWAPGRGISTDSSRPLLEVFLSDPIQSAGRLRLDLCVPVTVCAHRQVA